MNPERYQELAGRLFEGDLSGAEAEELAGGLIANDALRQDLLGHLLLWDLWSQHHAPERSSEAFVRAWKIRLRAENEGADGFSDAVRARLEAPQPGPGLVQVFLQFAGRAFRRPAGLAWAASVLIIGLAAVFWLGTLRSTHAVTVIRGEAVCTACVLHESHEHAPAIRVITGDAAIVYYLDRNPAVTGLQERFCSGPTPVTAEGKSRVQSGRHLFDARRVTLPEPDETPDSSTNAVKIIFPI